MVRLRNIIGVTLCLTLSLFTLAGCGSQPQQSSSSPAESTSSSSSSSTGPDLQGHEPITVRLTATDAVAPALSELQSQYVVEKPWVTFANTVYGDAPAVLAAAASTTEPADGVFTLGGDEMNAVEAAGLIDPNTRQDMLSDEMVIVAATDSPIQGVTLNNLVAGTYRLALPDENLTEGILARQILTGLGLYEGTPGVDGLMVGVLAERDSLVITETVGNQFSYLDSDKQSVGIVKRSDVYRYGGVKIVGEVPANSHSIILIDAAVSDLPENLQPTPSVSASSTQAEATTSAATSTEAAPASTATISTTATISSSARTEEQRLEAVDASNKRRDQINDFLHWCTTDSDAVRIWTKWGFDIAA